VLRSRSPKLFQRQSETAAGRVSSEPNRRVCVSRSALWLLILLWAVVVPPSAKAAGWPKWPKKKPDLVTAGCSLDRNELELGSAAPLHAKVEATESMGHQLSYVWSGNGGKITGTGAAVQVDASGMNPGVYSLMATVRDAYQHSASCTLTFHVIEPPDRVTLSCGADPSVVEYGKPSVVRAQASDALGHSLHYRWFTNGGRLDNEEPDENGQRAEFNAADAMTGVYNITVRVEDDWGRAADCETTVRVQPPPPPPPPPPQPSNIAEIVFLLNRETMDEQARTQLRKVLVRLQEDSGARVSIESYAAPDEKEPGKLAAARAETVKRFLMVNGVEESRMQSLVGLGGKRGGLRNRTLDVIWLPKGLEY
jgi:outer membrane protein OmpA-like peptidoglycan-associated protein